MNPITIVSSEAALPISGIAHVSPNFICLLNLFFVKLSR